MMNPWKYRPANDQDLPGTERLRSIRRESGYGSALAQMLTLRMTALILKLWHRHSVRGLEFLPAQPPCIVVANHASHLDVFAIAAALPWRWSSQIYPVSAGDLFFKNAARSWLAATFLNALPLWRRGAVHHALEELRGRLVVGQDVILIFPEGTRSRTGEMATFKAGIGRLVAGTSIPVVPCRISGTFEALPPEARLPRSKKISVQFGQALSFQDASNDRSGWQSVAAALELAVKAL